MFEDIKPELKIVEMRPGIFKIDDSGLSNAFLVVGEEKACLIDTANGLNDIGAAVKNLTDKPLIVINTHGHPDHILGNACFEQVYLNHADWELAKSFILQPGVDAMRRERGWTFPEFTDINEGDVFDLGGRKLVAYALPGHSDGGIMLLCPEERLLFTGDAINHHLWLHAPENISVEECMEELEKKMFLMDKADYILHGHAGDYDDISLMQYLLDALKEIVEGKTDEDFERNGGPIEKAMCHMYKVDENKKFACYESLILYQKDNVRKNK